MTAPGHGWPPRLAREARLRVINTLLANDAAQAASDTVARKVERAGLLHVLGRSEEARQAYLDTLAQAPTDFGALNDFGALLAATGFRSAARTVHAEAVKHHPGNAKGHVNLANLLYHDGELAAARAHYEAALRLEPAHPNAHQGLGAVLAALGEHEGAERHRREGYRDQPITTLPYRGSGAPLPLLLLVSAGGGDLPTASFLDDRIFLTSVAVADFCPATTALPRHRLIFNAIGDADLCAGALAAAAMLSRRSHAPVINHPDAVLMTGRANNAMRLAGLAGVVTPRMVDSPGLCSRHETRHHVSRIEASPFRCCCAAPAATPGGISCASAPRRRSPMRRRSFRATGCWQSSPSTRAAATEEHANTG